MESFNKVPDAVNHRDSLQSSLREVELHLCASVRNFVVFLILLAPLIRLHYFLHQQVLKKIVVCLRLRVHHAHGAAKVHAVTSG